MSSGVDSTPRRSLRKTGRSDSGTSRRLDPRMGVGVIQVGRQSRARSPARRPSGGKLPELLAQHSSAVLPFPETFLLRKPQVNKPAPATWAEVWWGPEVKGVSRRQRSGRGPVWQGSPLLSLRAASRLVPLLSHPTSPLCGSKSQGKR